MGKRNAAKRLRAAAEFDASTFFEDAPESKGLYAIDGGWHPDDGQKITNLNKQKAQPRDQKYQKTIKPRSENQATLLRALDNHPLVCALGPAGTGKTYTIATLFVRLVVEQGLSFRDAYREVGKRLNGA